MALVALAALGGCSRKPKDREARVREAVAALERAAEEKDLGAVKEALVEDFRSDDGRGRKDLIAMLQMHFLRQQTVHVAQRVDAVTFPMEGHAEAKVTAAVAGTEIPSLEALAGVRADVFQFTFRFIEDGDGWLLAGANWRRARPGE